LKIAAPKKSRHADSRSRGANMSVENRRIGATGVWLGTMPLPGA
jgi:hypothetical protein